MPLRVEGPKAAQSVLVNVVCVWGGRGGAGACCVLVLLVGDVRGPWPFFPVALLGYMYGAMCGFMGLAHAVQAAELPWGRAQGPGSHLDLLHAACCGCAGARCTPFPHFSFAHAVSQIRIQISVAAPGPGAQPAHGASLHTPFLKFGFKFPLHAVAAPDAHPSHVSRLRHMLFLVFEFEHPLHAAAAPASDAQPLHGAAPGTWRAHDHHGR